MRQFSHGHSVLEQSKNAAKRSYPTHTSRTAFRLNSNKSRYGKRRLNHSDQSSPPYPPYQDQQYLLATLVQPVSGPTVMLTVAKEKRSNILRFMIAHKCVGRSTRFRCPSSATNSISIRTFQCTFLAACELVRNSLIEKSSSIADQIPTPQTDTKQKNQ